MLMVIWEDKMKLKSFAYLKKTNTCPVKEDLALSEKQKKVESQKKPVTPISQKLMESGYCYGCYNFSVTAPDTDLEMGFCRRIDKDGKISFKVIQTTTLIRQCPGKLSS